MNIDRPKASQMVLYEEGVVTELQHTLILAAFFGAFEETTNGLRLHHYPTFGASVHVNTETGNIGSRDTYSAQDTMLPERFTLREVERLRKLNKLEAS